MTRKIKMISLAAAALLAVVPVVSPAVVHAADTTSTTTTLNSNAENPVITYNGKKYDSNQDITAAIANSSFSRVPLKGSSTFIQDVKNAFSATESSTDNSKVNIVVYTGDLYTNIAGKYPVRVLATNKAGKSTALTFQVIVGNQGANATYAVAKPQVRGNVTLYTIRDGKVIHNSYGSYVLDGGTTVATFGTVEINGISYTRLNGPDSDLFIETKSVDGTYPESATNEDGQAKTVTKTLMHTAIAYNSDGHSTGKKYYAYRQLTLSAVKKNIKGSMYYNVQGTGDYIKVGNIDGTKRTLTRNAYIYATSKRRADRTLLRKGDTITTYGGSYKFKNGKRHYRIEGAKSTNKRYVKVVNFE